MSDEAKRQRTQEELDVLWAKHVEELRSGEEPKWSLAETGRGPAPICYWHDETAQPALLLRRRDEGRIDLAYGGVDWGDEMVVRFVTDVPCCVDVGLEGEDGRGDYSEENCWLGWYHRHEEISRAWFDSVRRDVYDDEDDE